MFPVIGAMMGGAGGILGGAAGGGFLSNLLGNLGNNGGLFGMLSNLFSGGQQAGGQGGEQTNQLLGDIKDMLGQLLDQKGAGESGGAGGSHGAEGGHGCGGGEKPGHGCGPEKPSDGCDGHDKPDCDGPKEPHCGGAEEHDCEGAGKSEKPEWDGKDKSPSLDRERGAARLLEQAKDTKDPEEKRELIEMALEMLGDGPKKGKGMFGKIADKMDGNSYDKDIVKQAEKMLDQIDKGCLSDCAEGKALDSVIDMLMEEGGVDGEPAANDLNGDGRFNKIDKWMDAGLMDAR